MNRSQDSLQASQIFLLIFEEELLAERLEGRTGEGISRPGPEDQMRQLSIRIFRQREMGIVSEATKQRLAFGKAKLIPTEQY